MSLTNAYLPVIGNLTAPGYVPWTAGYAATCEEAAAVAAGALCDGCYAEQFCATWGGHSVSAEWVPCSGPEEYMLVCRVDGEIVVPD